MIAVAAACAPSKPKRIAPKRVINIPSCAAAPNIKLLGLAISGPKSVIAPMPRNTSGGNNTHSTPFSM